MNDKIIDFHTHLFIDDVNNICSHKDIVDMSLERSVKLFKSFNVCKVCGSVISRQWNNTWEEVEHFNNEALKIQKETDGFFVPGFQVHPSFKKESIAEIERMHKQGVKLIGELVPEMEGWFDYATSDFYDILECAEHYKMVVSFHSIENEDSMDKMVKRFPEIVFVAAHPGEYSSFIRHMERMGYSSNYYLDLSGYGIFRYGMLRHALDEYGKTRFLFGSDFPTCSFPMYVGGVLLDDLLSEDERQAILFDNANRLLNLNLDK